jgi:hypothetical protein
MCSATSRASTTATNICPATAWNMDASGNPLVLLGLT